ncbi:MAG: hypothetical protein JO235_10415 [Chroococcidiopsidaceae cyanobacterium CP_BM_RX_35]|nr:hypothetical protein [Chroococcidiopsidaceae cyanobacterium CP_BM_RX_35]
MQTVDLVRSCRKNFVKTAAKPLVFKVLESVSQNHLHFYLIWYWRSNRTVARPRQMLFAALSAYWMPFALQECGEFSPAQLRESAAIAIRQLQEQVHTVKMHFLIGTDESVQKATVSAPAVILPTNEGGESEFRAVHTVQPNHLYSYLVRYWRSNRTVMEPRQMLFSALSAFWLPFALHSSGRFSVDELREYAAIATQQMEDQIELLKTHFYPMEVISCSSPPSKVELNDALEQEELDDDSDLFNSEPEENENL